MKDIKQIIELSDSELDKYIMMGLTHDTFIKKTVWETTQTIFKQLEKSGAVARRDTRHNEVYDIVGKKSGNIKPSQRKKLIKLLRREVKRSMVSKPTGGVLRGIISKLIGTGVH
jgi:tRNA C32,U32 (ribose-2'-O)-methylase TrmJ